MLILQLSMRIYEEIRTIYIYRHPLHYFLKLRMTGHQVLSFRFRVFYQLFCGERPPDKESILFFQVIHLMKSHRFRWPSQVIFQPPEDRLMLLRNSLNHLDLPFLWQPTL